MEIFEWDDRKAEENLRKHKVSFASAQTIFKDPFLLLRRDHSIDKEERLQAIGQTDEAVLLLVVHTVKYEDEATTRIRIISARYADRRERAVYRAANA